ncbi:hypothetical protein [Roseobacter ponti]|uniref:Uncharacterized protein n=1 Tax=Roseobacter ponti TaxID=1891787 RepID=A0A858SQJ0_9RHOB|nr:hypothetical protein [Roseobacter ponti]QJF51109.1 hypothetical protein G3256_08015 [Roseobacter ponti]
MAETARDHWLDMPERAAEYEEILNELRTDFWKCLTPGEGREPAQGEAALDGEDQGERL